MGGILAMLITEKHGDIMGEFLDTPKHSAHGEGNGLRYGLISMQGSRRELEDAHTAVVGLPRQAYADWSFFAVYDSHASCRVANYCSGHMLEHGWIHPSVEAMDNRIRSRFLKIGDHMCILPETELQGPEPDGSGCRAVGVLLTPDHLYFINCGNSQAVLSRDGQVCFSTMDQKPCNLSPEPEVRGWKRATKGDEFVVLACDGIWNVMSNKELCEFVHSRLLVHDDLEKVCNEVVDMCLHKGSRGNKSVVLVCFPGAPRVSEEAVRRDKELDKLLETRVKDLLNDGVPDLMNVVTSMATENIPYLPPAGGLASKYSLIKAVYSKLNRQRVNNELDETSFENNWTSLGSGGFGEVFKTRHRQWGKDVAIKVLNDAPGLEKGEVPEAEMMLRGECRYIMNILKIFKGRTPGSDKIKVGLVMDVMKRGSLVTLQRKRNLQLLPWALVFRLVHQVAVGMNYLHSLTPDAIIHKDLKPENILLDDDLNVKITDFGISKFAKNKTDISLKGFRTDFYAPPEVFIGLPGGATWAYDVYSYAVLIWTLLNPDYDDTFSPASFGKRPSLGDVQKMNAPGLEKLVELMVRCWDEDCDQRPPFAECTAETEDLYEKHKLGIDDAVHQVQQELDCCQITGNPEDTRIVGR